MITDNDKREAIKRIANTPDGRLLRRFLQLAVNELAVSVEMGALQVHHGRRSFAHDLKRLLEEGLTEAERENGGRSGPDDFDEPVAEPRRSPAERITRGLARRVPADPDAP